MSGKLTSGRDPCGDGVGSTGNGNVVGANNEGKGAIVCINVGGIEISGASVNEGGEGAIVSINVGGIVNSGASVNAGGEGAIVGMNVRGIEISGASVNEGGNGALVGVDVWGITDIGAMTGAIGVLDCSRKAWHAGLGLTMSVSFDVVIMFEVIAPFHTPSHGKSTDVPSLKL